MNTHTFKRSIWLGLFILISSSLIAPQLSYSKRKVDIVTTYTNILLLGKPASGARPWKDDEDRNKYIIDAVTWQLSENNRTLSGGALSAPTGLNIPVAESKHLINDLPFHVAADSGLTLTDDSLNFIYINSSGVLVASATPLTRSDYSLIGIADTASGSVTQYADLRQMQPLTGFEPVSGNESVGSGSGLQQWPNASSPLTDIDFSPGKIFDSTGKIPMILGSSFSKTMAAPFIEGDTNDGLLNGSVAIDSTYNIYLMTKSGGDTDIGFLKVGEDINTYIPANFLWYKWIGLAATSRTSTDLLFIIGDGSLLVSKDFGIYLIYGLAGSYPITLTDFSNIIPPQHIEAVNVEGTTTFYYDSAGNLSPSSTDIEPYPLDGQYYISTGISSGYYKTVSRLKMKR